MRPSQEQIADILNTYKQTHAGSQNDDTKKHVPMKEQNKTREKELNNNQSEVTNTLVEMKNTLQVTNCREDEAEDQI